MLLAFDALPLVEQIRAMYAQGEQGIWLDPSDFSSLFQDAAGTTPVTALGQPVGLALDKRLGMALGAELVTNGGFDSDTAWTDSNTGTGTAVISGGVLTLTGTDTSNRGRSYQALTVESGKMYRVTLAKTGSAASVWVGTSPGSTGVAAVDAASSSFVFLATAATVYLMFLTTSAGGTAVFDNISVREIAGNHAYQTTSASRPTVEARVNLLTYSEQMGNAAWGKTRTTVTSGAITGPLGALADKISEDTSTNTHYISQSVFVPSGVLYTASIYVKAAGRTRATWYMTDNVTGPSEANINLATGTVTSTGYGSWTGRSASIADVGGGWYRVTVSGVKGAGTGVNSILMFTDDSGTSFSYTGDGVSGMYATAAQLEYGPVSTYQKVNTATDYVDVGAPRYLQLDGTDDGMLTPSIDFTGTDKMTVWTGVRKLSDAARASVVELSASYGNSGTFAIEAPPSASDLIQWVSTGTSIVTVSATGLPAPTTRTITGIGNIAGDSAIIRVNGVQAASTSADQGTGNYGNYPLYIGRRNNASLPFNGRIYQLIVRGAASNAGQIAATEAYVNAKTRAY